MMKRRTAPSFSPGMISRLGSWCWVKDSFAADYDRLSAAGLFEPGDGSRTIWSTRSKYVLRVPVAPGFDVAYKGFYRVHGAQRYFFRPSPSSAEAVNYVRLAELGFPLPELLAVGEIRRGPFLRDAFFVSRFIDGYRNGLDFHGPGPHASDVPLMKAFCAGHLALLAKLHDAGILHYGFTPSNLLYRQTPSGLEFCWVDVADCKKAEIGLREIAEDVVQFFRHLNHIDAALRRELLAPYFDAVKVPRTNLDDLCALLEKRLVTRMKPRTDQTPPPLTASGSSTPANR